jgi:hypothetical protein
MVGHHPEVDELECSTTSTQCSRVEPNLTSGSSPWRDIRSAADRDPQRDRLSRREFDLIGQEVAIDSATSTTSSCACRTTPSPSDRVTGILDAHGQRLVQLAQTSSSSPSWRHFQPLTVLTGLYSMGVPLPHRRAEGAVLVDVAMASASVAMFIGFRRSGLVVTR